MRCKDCEYWYADFDEEPGTRYRWPYCHYPYDDDCAPCSYDDRDLEPELDERD